MLFALLKERPGWPLFSHPECGSVKDVQGRLAGLITGYSSGINPHAEPNVRRRL
jgi:hypothetical protein